MAVIRFVSFLIIVGLVIHSLGVSATYSDTPNIEKIQYGNGIGGVTEDSVFIYESYEQDIEYVKVIHMESGETELHVNPYDSVVKFPSPEVPSEYEVELYNGQDELIQSINLPRSSESTKIYKGDINEAA
jgi:hypothetical protein